MGFRVGAILPLMILLACSTGPTQTGPDQAAPSVDDFLGRWDVTVEGPEGTYPSWFELSREEGPLKGQFVGRVGSVRPIQTLEIQGDQLSFSLPVQYESHPVDMAFTGRLREGILQGTTNAEDGSALQ